MRTVLRVLAALNAAFQGLVGLAAVVALDPDRPVGFRRTLAAALLLNVAADLVVVSAGELALGQVVVGMGLELLFGVALLVPAGGVSGRS